MAGFRAVLFDIDGTLVDSNDHHAQAFHDVFERHGHSVPVEKIRPFIGMGSDKLTERLLGDKTTLEEREQMAEEKVDVFVKDYLPKVVPLPRANELLVHLKNAGFKLTVASAANPKELSGLLEILGIDGLLEGKPESSDEDETKPDPDIVQAALKVVGVEPKEAVLIGDTPYDVEAAGAAGVPCIALKSGGWTEASLVGAISVYKDPQELLAGLEHSPLRTRYQLAG